MATVEVVQRTGLIDLPISQLTLDPDVQCRESIDVRTVTEYKEHLASGGKFPASVVFFDGKIYWVADGFHRDAAYRASGVTECPCDVRSGTKRDAILYACGANSSHGLKRTNADKRRAVLTLLKDAEWSQKPSRWIAERCGVSHVTVQTIKDESLAQLEKFSNSKPETEPERVTGSDGKSYPAKHKLIEKPKVVKLSDMPEAELQSIAGSKPIEKVVEKAVVPEPEPVSEARPVGLVAIADEEPEDSEDPEEEELDAEDDGEECVSETPRGDLTETKEANDAIRIARTAVDAVWNKCPPSSRWRLKASIENHLAELTEEG